MQRWMGVLVAAATVASTAVWAEAAEGGPRAKNVILMISDGAGDTTWRAANMWQFGASAGTAPQFQQRYEGAGFQKQWVSTFAGHTQPSPPGQVAERANAAIGAPLFPPGSLPAYLPRLYNEVPFPGPGAYDPVRANNTTIGNVHLFTDRTRSLYQGRGTPLALTPVASNPSPVRQLANLLQQGGTITVNRQQGPLAYDYLLWEGVTDSASAGTALASGRKTYSSGINFVDVSPDPTNPILQRVPFLTEQVKAMGKSAGVVTTKPFTDATPAVFGTANVFRDNESAISNDMIQNGLLDVIISPGHPEYGTGGAPRTPSYGTVSQANLQSLRGGTAGGSRPWNFVDSTTDLISIANGTTPAPDRLFGLVPVGSSLNSRNTAGQTNAYDPRVHTPGNVPAGVVPFVMPDLADLAAAAINTLSKDNDGFFAMIEGASVDSAAHANNLPQLVEEQLAFNRAVDRVIQWVETNSSWEETLLIVTTDHANGLFLGPQSDTIPFQDPIAGLPGQLPQGMFWSTNHTNELVPMWTRGPGTEMFGGMFDGFDPRRGNYIDNTDIHRVMSVVVPEPGVVGLLAPAGLLLARRRRSAN